VCSLHSSAPSSVARRIRQAVPGVCDFSLVPSQEDSPAKEKKEAGREPLIVSKIPVLLREKGEPFRYRGNNGRRPKIWSRDGART